ncbi:putative transcription factor C2H2 family [Helianthus debilis subsp. tardiflorus]
MQANQDYHSSIMADSRNMIIKGKRTKRPRPSSPLSLTMASTSSTTTTSATTDGETENPNNTFHTTNTSIEFTRIVQENEEEEDMANCLILLAQSQSQGQSGSSPPLPLPAAEAVEVARTSEFYVYECKTCNRGFSSFQALGGHRASHKKPSNPNMVKQDMHVYHGSTELSLQIGSSQTSQCNPTGSMKVTKIHICSICGAEFGSGQALGGHMRRHRSMPVARTDCGDSSGCQESKKPKTLLPLDLNLPAPVDDDIRETKVRFRPDEQMIVFSNSSLVHCHI